MNHDELKETRKVKEKGEKRPLSHGLMLTPSSRQADRDNIKSKTDVFLAEGGSIERVEFGTMKTDTKGTTALRINCQQDVKTNKCRSIAICQKKIFVKN